MSVWGSGDPLTSTNLNTKRPTWSGTSPFYDVTMFGAKGDGVTDDTAAIQAAIDAADAVNGTVWLASTGTFLTNQLLVTSPLRIAGSGTLKVKSTFSKTAGDGVIVATARVEIDDLTIDADSKGRGGIVLGTGADKSIIRNPRFLNFTDAADSTSTSGVIVAAPDCTIINPRFDNFVWGNAQSNGSIPRCLSFNSGSAGSVVRGFRGATVNVIAVVADARIAFYDTAVDGAYADGFYCITGSDDVVIDGVALHNVSDPVVFEGANPTLRNYVHVVDDLSGMSGGAYIALDQSPSKVRLENVRVWAPTLNVPLISTRSGMGTCSGLRIRNCEVEAAIDTAPPLNFLAGTVNGLDIDGLDVTAHVTVTPGGELRFVKHTAGDQVFYRHTTWRLVDDSASLTNANFIRIIIPALSTYSLWGADNLLITDPSYQASLVVSTATANLAVQGDPLVNQANAGYLVPLNAALKRVSCAAVPSAGTWGVGDYVRNSNPSELGSAPNKYVVEGWICTAAGTFGGSAPTFLACRALTGN